MSSQEQIKLERIDDFRWRIPRQGGMLVPGIIYSDEKLLKKIQMDKSPRQVANVAHLPGIINYSLAMPDIHWGYGFPIGGVAAFDMEEGVISPGGVGYDINCGCRLMVTDLVLSDVKPDIKTLVAVLFNNVPTGVGSRGKVKLSISEEMKVLAGGAKWAVKNGYGSQADLERIEDHGCFEGANPELVSKKALERGKDQLGTLGSGNHFVEIGVVQEIFDNKAAEAFGLRENQVTVLIHSGSRGLGYQICDDFLAAMHRGMRKMAIELPDRQLACAPLRSRLGKDYFAAMACAANYAFVNRQLLMHWCREIFEKVLNISPGELNMRLVYDVCHNIAKKEIHLISGKKKEVCVHRKGATRAFPPGHPDIPLEYRSVGQPVLIPGDMGRSSYVLAGSKKAMEETFGSTCHGAGRVMSRTQAKKSCRGRNIAVELEKKGIIVMAERMSTLVEEVPEAYKDVSHVVEVVHRAGLARKVAKLRPLGVIKG